MSEENRAQEHKAKTARENGAKSKGPTSEAGNAKSARNALKDGARSEKFAHFLPPHVAVLCNEDRKLYGAIVEELVAIYKPQDQSAFAVVGDMANARWQIDCLNRCITMHWNLAMIDANQRPKGTLNPELHEMKILADASAELLSGAGILPKLNREIARLQQSIARSARTIKFIHANFPDFAPAPNKQTQPEEEENAANEELNQTEPEKSQDELPPIFTSENVPEVIAAYQREFPGRRIVIVPSENVNFDDKMARAPRKAA